MYNAKFCILIISQSKNIKSVQLTLGEFTSEVVLLFHIFWMH